MPVLDKQSDIDAHAELMLMARHDPVAWVRATGDEPWSGQEEILRAIADHKNVAVRSCHGIGKDWTAARIAMWFLYNFSPSLVITTGPTDRQVRGILWKEIALFHQANRLGGTCLTQKLELAVDWYAIGFTAPGTSKDKFQGFHEKNLLVIVDEASGVTPEIYDSLKAVLSSSNARLVEIGNPTDPFSTFAKSFKKAKTVKLSFSCYDTPNFTAFSLTEKDFIDDGVLKDTWETKIGGAELPMPKLVTPHWVADRLEDGWVPGTALYDARIMGVFPSESPDSLIRLSWIERAAGYKDKQKGLPVELGVDIAGGGGDWTVIVLRQGDYVKIIHESQERDTMKTVNKCVELRAKYNATKIKVDVCGLGKGPVDRLTEMGEPVVGCNAGANSRFPDTYANAKAEWLWLLRARFENQHIMLDVDDVDKFAPQLTEFRSRLDPRGRCLIEPKDTMKKRLGRSPDHADALAIVFSEPVVDKKEDGAVSYFV